MSRTAQVKIGSVHLTHDGTSGGRPCKVTVEQESAFASALAGNTVVAADATPHTQLISRGVKGIEFGVLIEYCPESLLSSILGQLTTALAGTGTVRVTCDSLTDFDVLAAPQFQDGALFTFESRSGGYAKGVRLRFISTAAGA